MSRSDPVVVRVRLSLGRIDPRMEWPRGFVRFGVAAWLAVTVLLGLLYFGKAVDRLGGEATRNATANFDDRAFGGGNALGVDKEALNEARGWIPARGTYRLLVGPDAADIRNYVRYFLMPRRPDPGAAWVLCYGCDLARLGDELEIVWRDAAGIAVGRLPG